MAPTSLRAAFGSFDLRGEGVISVNDVRPALERAGVDTSGTVASAVLRQLDEHPMRIVEFAHFQRIAHTISSQHTDPKASNTQKQSLRTSCPAASYPSSSYPSSSYPPASYPPASYPSASYPPTQPLSRSSGTLSSSLYQTSNADPRKMARKPTMPTRA